MITVSQPASTRTITQARVDVAGCAVGSYFGINKPDEQSG